MWLGLLILFLLPGLSTGQTAPPAVARDVLDAHVQAQKEKWNAPGLCVAVVRDGEPEYMVGVGLANLEHSVPADPSTVYRIGSLTKTFTAALILLLEEADLLSVEDPVGSHLPDLPESWSGITLHHLLTHTSGIPNYTALPAFRVDPRRDYGPQEIMDLVRDLPLEFDPGTRWSYSNTGYYLLGMVVETVVGKPFDLVLLEKICRPLELTRTRMDDPARIQPHRAAGYIVVSGRTLNAPYLSMTQPFASGAMVSSLEDLVRWELALENGTLLSRQTLERMWTPVSLPGDLESAYGYGWIVDTMGGHRSIGHGGGMPGFNSCILRFPDDRLTVIVLANLDAVPAERLARGIAALYLPEVAEPTEPVEDPDVARTVLLQDLLLAMAKGSASPDTFTPEAAQQLFPNRMQAAQQALESAGPLHEFYLVGHSSEGGLARLRYRAVFEKVTLTVFFEVTAEGKVSAVGMRPE